MVCPVTEIALSEGLNRVSVSPLIWGCKHIQFLICCVLQCFVGYWVMDKVQNPSNPEYHKQFSEPFTIYLMCSVGNEIWNLRLCFRADVCLLSFELPDVFCNVQHSPVFNGMKCCSEMAPVFTLLQVLPTWENVAEPQASTCEALKMLLLWQDLHNSINSRYAHLLQTPGQTFKLKLWIHVSKRLLHLTLSDWASWIHGNISDFHSRCVWL